MNQELLDLIVKALKTIKDEHSEELLKIIQYYGPMAADKILDMLLKDEDIGSQLYYDALEQLSASDLLDSAINDFNEARQNKKEFKLFLQNVGKGLGIVVKALLKSVSPI